MSGWFTGILWNSLAVSAFALVLLCFFPFLNRNFKARTHYYLWVIVLLFLVNPFHPQIAALELPGPAAQFPAQVSTWVEQPDTSAAAPKVTTGAADTAQIGQTEAVIHARALALLPKTIPYLWLCGCLFVFLRGIIRHKRLYRSFLRTGHSASSPFIEATLKRIKEEMGISVPISLIISPAVRAPMSTGLRKPVIILPHEDYGAQEIAYILMHELTHCRRRDQLVKWLMLLATAVNWFNPIIYVFRKIADHLCELSCDAEVLKGHDRTERFAYGVLVLESGAPARPMPLASGFGAGKKLVMQRLRLIMDGGAKRGGAFLIVLVLLACTSLSVSFVKADGKPGNSVNSLLSNSGSVLLKASGTGNNEQLHQIGEIVDFKPINSFWQQYTINKVTVYDSLADARLQTSDLLHPEYADSNGNFKPGYELLVVDMTEKNILPYSNISTEDAERCCIQSAIYRGFKSPVRISNELTYLSDSLAKQTGKEDEDEYFVKIPVGESRSFRAGWVVDTRVKAASDNDGNLYLSVCDAGNNENQQWVSLGKMN